MNSPYFWKNVALLVLVAANFAFSVWQVRRTPADVRAGSGAVVVQNSAGSVEAEMDGVDRLPLFFRIVRRLLTVIYFSASIFVFVGCGDLFLEMEVSPYSRVLEAAERLAAGGDGDDQAAGDGDFGRAGSVR